MLHPDPRGFLALFAGAETLRGDGISQKERALLNRLRDSLGIAAADAEALERDLQAGRPGHAQLAAPWGDPRRSNSRRTSRKAERCVTTLGACAS